LAGVAAAARADMIADDPLRIPRDDRPRSRRSRRGNGHLPL